MLQDCNKRFIKCTSRHGQKKFKEAENNVFDAITNHKHCIELLNLSKNPFLYTLGGSLDKFRGFAEVADSVLTQLIH